MSYAGNTEVSSTCELSRQPSLMTPHIPPPLHRSGRGPPWWMDTNLKVSESKTSQPVEKRNFYLPNLHLAPPMGVMIDQNFVEIFCIVKLQSLALFKLIHFDTTLACHGWTERQGHSIYRAAKHPAVNNNNIHRL